ncbi:MAG: HypC/HybG/HupF family hydrogenase formation chaperone [Coriobacteriia bacterium]|nr:HypC/HybG/HupF family hydrogenase formation chaperone [Coriobacteriia bacterium]
MCLAVPATIKTINPDRTAIVDLLGVERTVAIELVPTAKVGDYVLVHAGFAIEVISLEAAEETLAFFREFPELAEGL